MKEEFDALREMVEKALDACFTCADLQEDLRSAMRYSLLAGGKRVRPVLMLAFCRACGGDVSAALPAACGIEMLHTYSLIHDDLPCMDDDDLRRGKPTNHKVYGETLAVLAGDALQAEAFSAVLSCSLPSAERAAMAAELAHAAGASGICGGQTMDMKNEGRAIGVGEVERTHELKTASLLRCAAKMGVIAANGSRAQLEAADSYAYSVGMAFQIRDDMLDIMSTEAELGKNVHADAKSGKTTFATLYGLEHCQRIVEEETKKAKDAVTGAFDDSRLLCFIADSLAGRTA